MISDQDGAGWLQIVGIPGLCYLPRGSPWPQSPGEFIVMETLNTLRTDHGPVPHRSLTGPSQVPQSDSVLVYGGDERCGDIYDDIPRLCLFLPRLQFSRGHNSSLLHRTGPSPVLGPATDWCLDS